MHDSGLHFHVGCVAFSSHPSSLSPHSFTFFSSRLTFLPSLSPHSRLSFYLPAPPPASLPSPFTHPPKLSISYTSIYTPLSPTSLYVHFSTLPSTTSLFLTSLSPPRPSTPSTTLSLASLSSRPPSLTRPVIAAGGQTNSKSHYHGPEKRTAKKEGKRRANIN